MRENETTATPLEDQLAEAERIKADPPSYVQMSDRILEARGGASDHTCNKCGQPATNWSFEVCSMGIYQHTAEPGELRHGWYQGDDWGFTSYCAHVEHYEPRCDKHDGYEYVYVPKSRPLKSESEPPKSLPEEAPPTPARRQPTDATLTKWRIDLEDVLSFVMGLVIVVFLVWWIFLSANEDPPAPPAPQDIGTRIDRVPVDPIVPEVPDDTRLAP